MPKTNGPKAHRANHRLPSRPAPKTVVVVASDTLAQTLQLVKETDARSRVLFTKIHNLQTEVAALTNNLGKVLTLLSELFDRPTTATEAQSIIHDFLRKQYNIGAS